MKNLFKFFLVIDIFGREHEGKKIKNNNNNNKSDKHGWFVRPPEKMFL